MPAPIATAVRTALTARLISHLLALIRVTLQPRAQRWLRIAVIPFQRIVRNGNRKLFDRPRGRKSAAVDGDCLAVVGGSAHRPCVAAGRGGHPEQRSEERRVGKECRS